MQGVLLDDFGYCAIAPDASPAAGLDLVERDLPAAVLAAADELMASGFTGLQFHARAEGLADAFPELSARASRAALADDIARLARAYAVATGEQTLDIRLERVTDDACRAFHRDRVRLRLVTTYLGPGTQYVADADAERALQSRRSYAGPVHAVPTGALAWMRGALADEGGGLVHRSPPIEGTGTERLVLAITGVARRETDTG